MFLNLSSTPKIASEVQKITMKGQNGLKYKAVIPKPELIVYISRSQ